MRSKWLTRCRRKLTVTRQPEEAGEPAESAPYAEPLLTSGMVAKEKPEGNGPLWSAAQEGEERAESRSDEPEAGEDSAQSGADTEKPAASVQSPMTNGGPPAGARSPDPVEEDAGPRRRQERTVPVAAGRPVSPNSSQVLHITFSRSGQFDRDKYRLREIFDAVRDPRGRDQFVVVMETNGSRHQLTFPNEFCTVSDRLLHELRNDFKVVVAVESGAGGR